MRSTFAFFISLLALVVSSAALAQAQPQAPIELDEITGDRCARADRPLGDVPQSVQVLNTQADRGSAEAELERRRGAGQARAPAIRCRPRRSPAPRKLIAAATCWSCVDGVPLNIAAA